MSKVGQQIGNYRLLKLLGTGGFAEVYLAEHLHLQNRQAAIKILHASLPQSEHQNFFREAQTLEALQHANIVKIVDFGIWQSCAYMVMPFYPQGTLRDKHNRGIIIPTEIVVEYVKQIAAALQFAHDNKLIHRDLKPENILVDGTKLLLSDFGIATLVRNTTKLEEQPEVYIGSPPYSAPEQIQGKARMESDQYALAIIVYEWLMGIRPFLGASETLQYQHLVSTPPPMKGVNPAIEAVVMKALHKDPHKRFTSVNDFADALEEASTVPLQKPMTDINTQTRVQTIQPYTRLTSSPFGQYQQFAWSPDGRYIAALNQKRRYKGGIQVFDASTMQHISTITKERIFGEFIWSPDGTRIATVNGRGQFYSLDVLTGDRIDYCQNFDNLKFHQKWSSDGKWILIPSQEDIKICDAVTGKTTFVYSWTDPQTDVKRNYYSSSPDLSKIAIEKNGSIQIISIINGETLLTYDKHSHNRLLRLQISWSPDNTCIASLSQISGEPTHNLQVWDVLTGHTFFTRSGSIDNVDWSTDSTRLAFRDFVDIHTGRSNVVQIVNANIGAEIFTIQGNNLYPVLWSPDSSWIAIGSPAGTNIWNTDNYKLQYICQPSVSDMAWSPNGRIAGRETIDGSRDFDLEAGNSLLVWKFS